MENKNLPYLQKGLSVKLRSRTRDVEEASINPKVIGQIAFKHIRLILQYKFDIIYWIFMPLLWMIPFIWLGKALLENNQSPTFLKYTGSGDYIGFLLVGSMLWATIDSAIWGAGNSLRWEQQSGTLEFLWVAPVARTDILTGAALGETGWVFTNIIGQFIIISMIFGWKLTLENTFISFLAVIIMFIGMLGFGFLFASVIMIFKEPGVLTELTESLLFIISPVRYPIQGLPTILRFLSVAFPFTWGAKIVRNLLIAQQGISTVLFSFIILLFIDLMFWIIGYKVFKRVEHRSRRTGNLGHF